VACSAVARRRQGVAGDHEGVTGKVSGKEERTGRTGTVRRCKQRRAAAFIRGEGAPVVTGGGDEILQLGRGESVRDLQEISGIGTSGRSSPGGVADGGGARSESTRESGLQVAGGSGPGAGSGGEARALERRGRRGVGTGGRVGAVVGAAERERKERGGVRQ
jgi:hypothetical protein